MFETTAQFTTSVALAASVADFNPIAAWVGRVAPQSANVLVTILMNATTAGVRLDLKSGTRSIQPRAQVQGGGTAGTLPNPLSTAAIQFIAYAGEEIQPLVYETLAGTPTVNLLINWEVV